MPRTKQQRPRHILGRRAVGCGENSPGKEESMFNEYESDPGSSQSTPPCKISCSKTETGTHEISLPVDALSTPGISGLCGNRHMEMLAKAVQIHDSKSGILKPCPADETKINKEHQTSPGIEHVMSSNLNCDGSGTRDKQIQTMLDTFMVNPFRAMAKMLLNTSKQSNVDGIEARYLSAEEDTIEKKTRLEHMPHGISLLGPTTAGRSTRESGADSNVTSGLMARDMCNHEQRNEIALSESVQNSQTRASEVLERGDKPRPSEGDRDCQKEVVTDNKISRLRADEGPALRRIQDVDDEAENTKRENKEEVQNNLDSFNSLQKSNIMYGQPIFPWCGLPPPFPLSPFNLRSQNSHDISDIAKKTLGFPTSDFWQSIHCGIVKENLINKSTAFPILSELGCKRKHKENDSPARNDAQSDSETTVKSRRNFVPPTSQWLSPGERVNEGLYLTSPKNGMEPRFDLSQHVSPLVAGQYPTLSLNFEYPLSMPHYFNAWPLIYNQAQMRPDSVESKQSDMPIPPPRSPEYGQSRPAFRSGGPAKSGRMQTHLKHHNTAPLQNLHDKIVREAKEKNKGLDPENMYIECPVCRKRIKRLYHFQRHMRIHTGEKTHSCPNCPYKSVRKDNLKSHMKTHEKSKFDAPKRSQSRRDVTMQRYETPDDFCQASAQLTHSPKEPLPCSSSSALSGGRNLYVPPFGTSPSRFTHSGTSNTKHLPFVAGTYEFTPTIHDQIMYDNRAYSSFFSPRNFHMDAFYTKNRLEAPQIKARQPLRHLSLTKVMTTDVGTISAQGGIDQEYHIEATPNTDQQRRPSSSPSGIPSAKKRDADSFDVDGASPISNYREMQGRDSKDLVNTLPINTNNCNNAGAKFLSNLSMSSNLNVTTTSSSHSFKLRDSSHWQKSASVLENVEFPTDSKQDRDLKRTMIPLYSYAPVREQNSVHCMPDTKYFQAEASGNVADESKRYHGENKSSDDSVFFKQEQSGSSPSRTCIIPSNAYYRGSDTRTRRICSAPDINDSPDSLRDSSNLQISNGRRSADEDLSKTQRVHHSPFFSEIAKKANMDMKEKSFNESIRCERRSSGSLLCRDFNCRLCDYVAPNNSILQEHMGIHKEHGLYRCENCDYRGKNLSKLVEHKRIHTGERPFQCDKCSYAAKRKDNLAQHKSVKHDKNRYKGPSARVLQLSTRLVQDVDNPFGATPDSETAPISAEISTEGFGRYIPSSWNSLSHGSGRSGIRPHTLLSEEWQTKPRSAVFPEIADSPEGMLGIDGSVKLESKTQEHEQFLGTSQDFRFAIRHQQRILPYSTIGPSFLFANPIAVASPIPATRLKTGANASTYDTKNDFSILSKSPTGTKQLMTAKPGVLLCQKAAQQCAQ